MLQCEMRTCKMIGIAGLLALVAMTQAAAAQVLTQPTPPELVRLVRTPSYQVTAIRAAASTGAWQILGCSSATYSPSEIVAVLKAPLFDGAGQPIDGLWQERVIARGCSRQMTLNIAVDARPPSKLQIGPMLPGDTHANAVLQTDASQTIRTLFGAPAAGCASRTFFAETRYVGPEPGGAVQGWMEKWPISSCGKTTTYTVHFVPDPKGGMFIKILPGETVSPS